MLTNDLVFDYFLGDESEQFSFIRVPKIFFMDKRFDKLSYGAKIMYGLLLDRMSLSRKNNWRDTQGRTYVIYTIESIQEDFNVSKTTAVNFVKELEEFGLIEKKKRPNAPAMIYVKNFLPHKEKNAENQQNSGSPENGIPEVQNMEVQKMESRKSQEISGSLKNGLPKTKLPEVQKMESNKTNIINKTNNILSSSSEREEMRMMIQERINYNVIIEYEPELQMVDEIINCLVNIFDSPKTGYKIDGYMVSLEQIKTKILHNLSEENFKVILKNIQSNGAETIHNLQNYVMVCFYKLLSVSTVKESRKTGNRFNDFEQNNYDFDKLERELLQSYKT